MSLITVNIFTYAGDAPMLPYCVSSILRAHSDLTVHVIDDANVPIPEGAVVTLKNLSDRVHYRQSSFNRNGNLRGPDAVRGIVAELIKSSGEDEGVSVKIDTDVLMLKADWLNDIIANNTPMCCSLRPGNVASGTCYVLRNDTLPKLLKSLHTLELDELCPEDVAILSVAQALTREGECKIIIPQSESNKTGTWCGWDYNLSERYLASIVPRMDIISFGNWKFYQGCPKEYAVEVMGRCFDASNR